MDALARSWKVLVLLAGVIGAIGFFQPFYEYPDIDFEVSAYKLAVGFKSVDEVGTQRLGLEPEQATSKLAQVRLREFEAAIRNEELTVVSRGGAESTSEHRSFVPYYFLGAALLLAIAFYSLVEKKLSTTTAWVVLLASLPTLWGFARAWKMASSAHIDLGTGALLLGGMGIATLGVGFGALVREDPGGFFRNSPTHDDTITEVLQDHRGKRTVRDARDV